MSRTIRACTAIFLAALACSSPASSRHASDSVWTGHDGLREPALGMELDASTPASDAAPSSTERDSSATTSFD